MGVKKGDKAKDFTLSDHDGKEIRLSEYGIFREKDGFSERANIIVDENQEVMFAKIYPIAQLPDIEEIITVLESS